MTNEDFISVDYVFSLLPDSFWVESPVCTTADPAIYHEGLSRQDLGPCAGHWIETDFQEREGSDHGIRDSER